MGKCRNCEKEITLKGEENICPSCGIVDPFICWNCQETVTCKESNMCDKCHWYICHNCGTCGKTCNLIFLIKECVENHKDTLIKTIRDIIKRTNEARDGKKHLSCPIRNVPISYAHGGKIKRMVMKIKGINTKSVEDKNRFIQRLQQISEMKIGERWTVSQKREIGTHGIEDREVANLACCLGLAKKIIEKNQNNQEYELYERINGEPCTFAMTEPKIKKKCPRCKNIFNEAEMTHCNNCVYKKGSEKGKPLKLIELKSEIDFCQFPRINFVDKNIIKKETEKEGDGCGDTCT